MKKNYYENKLGDLACQMETEANNILDLCQKVNEIRKRIIKEQGNDNHNS